MAPVYEHILPLLPSGASILDAGCGSGRDAAFFKKEGYAVTAIDASAALCKLASKHIGQDVHCLRFDEIEWVGAFDAVWACASLLHVQHSNLSSTLVRLFRALKPGGVVYCSFKYGDGERERGGRWFTDLDETRLGEVISETGVPVELEMWVTNDQRQDRDEKWLNALIRTQSS